MSSPSSPQNPEPALNATTPLSIERPGDALALVHHTFGHIPEESLVLIGLAGGTTGGHLRVDLAPARQAPEALGQQCASWIAGPGAAPAPEAVLAIIFDSCTPDQDAPDRHDVLLGTLAEDLLRHADARLIKVWHCGAGYIRDYECCDPLCCPYPGEAAGPALVMALQRVPVLAGTRAYSPEESVEAFLSRSPLIAQELIDSIRYHRVPIPQPLEAVLTLWDAALCRGIRQRDSTGWADCEWIHGAPARASALLGTLERSARTDLIMALTTSGLDAVIGHVLEERGSTDHLEQAVWGLSQAPPQWERVEALDNLLHQLVPFAEGYQYEQMLGLKAWIEWICGRGSNASAFVERAQQLTPGRRSSEAKPSLARTVSGHMSRIGICPWARVKQSSYSWWSGNTRIISG